MSIIGRILKENKNAYFNLSVDNGKYSTTNMESYYGKKLPDPHFSFDVSNNKSIASIDEFGRVKQLSFFQENYLVEDKPGVWVSKHFTQVEDLNFSIEVNGESLSLNGEDSQVYSDVLYDYFPRIQHIFSNLKVVFVPFCPILSDARRLSVLTYLIIVENHTNSDLTVKIELTPLYRQKYSDTRNVMSVSKDAEDRIIQLEIPANQYRSTTLAYGDPNCYQDLDLYFQLDHQELFESTFGYFEQMCGNLEMEDDYTAHLFRRVMMQAFGAYGMNNKGELVGSSWGTFPVTNRIWNKDMYYSGLPFTMFEPELCQKTILWFTKYGVKFPGSKFPGGIEHSLSNSLSAILLAGIYYENTEDAQFFLDYPEVITTARNIIDTLLEKRGENDPYLFRSLWISDAFSLGKYHTGSNICMWKACKAMSQILPSVYDDHVAGKYYKQISEKIKKTIMEQMVVEGPFGEQFLEGIRDVDVQNKDTYPSVHYQKPMVEQGLIFLTDVIKDGEINLMMHDGEESDTTLIPFYNFLPYESTILKQYAAFTTSKYNPTYSERIRGITWGDESGATFPGFVTALMSVNNEQEWSGNNGFLTELKRLVDLDGSWWWWPYKIGASRGEIVRNFGCGKCGWASGIFVSLFITKFIGLKKENKGFLFRPFTGIDNFYWRNFRFGKYTFDILFEKSDKSQEVMIKNRTEENAPFFIQLNEGQEVEVIGTNEYRTKKISILNETYMEIKCILYKNQQVTVKVTGGNHEYIKRNHYIQK